MGKHEAPVPPKIQRVHWFVQICTHHGMHVAGAVILHVTAFIVGAPIVGALMGNGGGH